MAVLLEEEREEGLGELIVSLQDISELILPHIMIFCQDIIYIKKYRRSSFLSCYLLTESKALRYYRTKRGKGPPDEPREGLCI
jgi:hypothetical protein